MGRAFLLTGRPGVGKTTVIQAVAARLGTTAGGFYTQEMRERGQRIGFRLVTLDGASGILASVNISGPCRVGRYGVHLHDLEQVGVKALRQASERPEVTTVVIDEIGKMELCSQAFREAVLAALDSPKTVLATVMERATVVAGRATVVAGPHPWVDAIKARPRVTLVEVTVANRQALPERILHWLEQAPEGTTSA
jgi:nucleoside-triphosphatase